MQRRIGLLLSILATAGGLTRGDELAAQTDPVEPCCNIARIDRAGGTVTVKDIASRFTFVLTMASPAAAGDLLVGAPIAFSNSSNTLFVLGGRTARRLQLSKVEFTGFNQGTQVGVTGNSASGSGSFQNPPDGKCGKVGTIKETPTQQCVVTTSSGAGCWFCVPIKK